MPADVTLSVGRLRVPGGQGRGHHAVLLSAALHLAFAGLGLAIWQTRPNAPAAPAMVVELIVPESPAPAAPPEPPRAVPETPPEVRPVVRPKAPRKVVRPQALPRPTPTPAPTPAPTPTPAPAPTPDAVPVQAEAAAMPPTAGAAQEPAVVEKVVSPAPAPVDEEMAHYALAVRLALGRAARDHAGPKGRVEIAFGLDGQGDVRMAGITRSSGNPDLDAAALALVRTTAFPLPPENSSDGQRSYVIPIEFR